MITKDTDELPEENSGNFNSDWLACKCLLIIDLLWQRRKDHPPWRREAKLSTWTERSSWSFPVRCITSGSYLSTGGTRCSRWRHAVSTVWKRESFKHSNTPSWSAVVDTGSLRRTPAPALYPLWIRFILAVPAPLPTIPTLFKPDDL